jgi:glucokinase
VEDRKVEKVVTLQLAETQSLAPVLSQVSAALHGLLGEERAGHAPKYLVMGFPGIVDAGANRVSAINGKYEGAIEFDFLAWARQEFRLPILLENDARLALLGECYAGAAQGETDVVMFTLGTGIGGVAMMNGRPLHGKHGQAGLLGGHVPVIFNGCACSCGGIGCAEAEAAGWSLPSVCRDWPGFASSAVAHQKLDFKNLFAAAASGDKVALGIREHCLNIWSATAVAAIHAFDPDLILLGGGVMQNGEIILPYIQDYVTRHAWTPWGRVRVARAQLGNEAALLGAVPLLTDQTSTERCQELRIVR